MAKQQTDQLIQLIRSLSKAEKRAFKLYARRNSSGNNGEMKFLMLFDTLDKMKVYDEDQLLKKTPGIKRSQLSNLKAHLYKQLLVSLRLTHSVDNSDVQIRERIDYARVLYNKGLYQQSLRWLENARVLARETRNDLLVLETLSFERLIESQYITRSIHTRADELTIEAEEANRVIGMTNQLANLSLKLYGLYLKVGYARNEKDYYMVKEFFHSNLPDVEEAQLTYFEKLYLYMSYVWYHYITQDFLQCYRYATRWVNLFRDYPEMQQYRPDLYIKGMHNLLAALFNIQHYEHFIEMLDELEHFADKRDEFQFTENTELQLFQFVYTNRINKYYMEGRFTDGLSLVPEIEAGIERFGYKMDSHHILLFWYKIGCLYFGSGDNKMAIRYLNKIINYPDTQLREDIHCFARILNLIAHFELGNDDLVDYQVRSVYRFLGKMEDLHLVQQAIFKFLRKLPSISPDMLTSEFGKLHEKLVSLKEQPFEKRPFLYLDIISWLECKRDGVTVQEVIQNNFKNRKKRN